MYVCIHNTHMYGRSACVRTGELSSDQQVPALVGGEEEGGVAAKTDTPLEGDEPITWNSLGWRVRQLCIDFCPKVRENTAQSE